MKTKIILFWTDFFDEKYWGLGKQTLTEDDLKTMGCPVTNCRLSHIRFYKESADLLVFHVTGFGIPPDLPDVRFSDQSYVMFTLESPSHVGTKYKNYGNIFNLTMTYRIDSDIQMKYGKVRDKATGKIVAPSYEPNWRKVDENVTLGEISKNNFKLI